jgi:hypothetical protein
VTEYEIILYTTLVNVGRKLNDFDQTLFPSNIFIDERDANNEDRMLARPSNGVGWDSTTLRRERI